MNKLFENWRKYLEEDEEEGRGEYYDEEEGLAGYVDLTPEMSMDDQGPPLPEDWPEEEEEEEFAPEDRIAPRRAPTRDELWALVHGKPGVPGIEQLKMKKARATARSKPADWVGGIPPKG